MGGTNKWQPAGGSQPAQTARMFYLRPVKGDDKELNLDLRLGEVTRNIAEDIWYRPQDYCVIRDENGKIFAIIHRDFVPKGNKPVSSETLAKWTNKLESVVRTGNKRRSSVARKEIGAHYNALPDTWKKLFNGLVGRCVNYDRPQMLNIYSQCLIAAPDYMQVLQDDDITELRLSMVAYTRPDIKPDKLNTGQLPRKGFNTTYWPRTARSRAEAEDWANRFISTLTRIVSKRKAYKQGLLDAQQEKLGNILQRIQQRRERLQADDGTGPDDN